jgi:hypothetical protein
MEIFTKNSAKCTIFQSTICNKFSSLMWCTSITIMIEKDPGNPWIERLQVIHLFEADMGESNGTPRRGQ